MKPTANPLLLLLLTALALAGCSDDGADRGGSENGDGLALGAEDPDLGKSVFEPTGDVDTKGDALQGARGLSVDVAGDSMEVWAALNEWTDTDTPAAREAGIAWEADSDLDWDEKYAAWIKSMRKVDGHEYGETFELTTPWGKTLPAPAIECAETSLFLRATFASWYNLPFFVEARDAQGRRLYLGHFGFRTADGKYGRTPSFKTAYADYTDRADTWETEGWPTDEKLRNRRLGGSQDDFQPALFEGARAGAYFDEAFLNKRTGYFMIFLLSFFGSVNLADPVNTYNLAPEAIREGDTVLHRWQRRGIGHTLVVKNVEAPLEGFLEVELVSGSMPRRQPKWESPASSKYSLTAQKAGGPDVNQADDLPYAKLGGGLKRWRIAAVVGGRWTNVVNPRDEAHFVDATDTDAIGARVEKFEELLTEPSPEARRAGILERVEAAREHLRRYPASCAARIRREEAFGDLYALEAEVTGADEATTESRYRDFEDFVFAALLYEESKTCCWNSTNVAMYEIIVDKALSEVEDHTAMECRPPSVFKATDGGYDLWKDHAVALGRGDEWVDWSEDEPCAQRDVTEDIIDAEKGADFCEVGALLLGVEDEDPGLDEGDAG
ncbi:MAG: hypothetical protein ACYTF3_00655 [Planctomycetota bacterium]